MNYINIRKSIQNAGDELYHRLGETSRNLQYLAGEIMAGNEEYVRRLKIENYIPYPIHCNIAFIHPEKRGGFSHISPSNLLFILKS